MSDEEREAKKADIEKRLLAISEEIREFVGNRRFECHVKDSFCGVLTAVAAFGGLAGMDDEEPAGAKAVHRGKFWEVE